MSNSNSNLVNFGYSSRLPYDGCAYPDKLHESTGPVKYRLDENFVHNCNGCLSTFGPRSGFMGNGVSTTQGHLPASAQKEVDVESILKNLNVKQSKCKVGKVNHVDVTKFGLKNLPICNKYLDPLSSRLTYPAATYRDMAVNRFYDLPQDAQANIFYDFATNTRLEAKDNFMVQLPRPRTDNSLPVEIKGTNPPVVIRDGAYCPRQ
jgi:hypothetical protein